MGTSKTIKITCQGAALIDLDKITFFQENLKSLSDNNFQKLKNSIIRYGISFPFYVWKRNGKFNCIDGHQRQRVLLEMRKENYKIPPLPVDWIEAKDEKEAKEKILLATSQYGEMNNYTLAGFLEETDQSFPDLIDLINLPAIDMKFFKDYDEDKDSSTEISSKYMIIVECADEQAQVEMLNRFSEEGIKCRALIS